jgi:hypothetical protein
VHANMPMKGRVQRNINGRSGSAPGIVRVSTNEFSCSTEAVGLGPLRDIQPLTGLIFSFAFVLAGDPDDEQ